jgi:hypothetical protein
MFETEGSLTGFTSERQEIDLAAKVAVGAYVFGVTDKHLGVACGFLRWRCG